MFRFKCFFQISCFLYFLLLVLILSSIDLILIILIAVIIIKYFLHLLHEKNLNFPSSKIPIFQSSEAPESL